MNEFWVADEFTPDLGGRYPSDGDFSGEEFRERYLIPLVADAIKEDRQVTINFDGVSGLPTSFLEEAFGGMMRVKRDWTIEAVRSHVSLVAPQSQKLWPFLRFAEGAMKKAALRR